MGGTQVRRRIAAASIALTLAAVSLGAAAPATLAQGEQSEDRGPPQSAELGTFEKGLGEPSFASKLQAKPSRFDVVLGLRRRQHALQRFARKVSIPASPKYGRYLRPRQVGRRFGARRGVTRSVRSFLRRRGIHSEVDVTRSLVEALVRAPKARRLFGGPNGHERVPRALRGKVRQVLLNEAGRGQFLPRSKRSDAGDASSPGRAEEDLKPPHVRTGTPAGCRQGQNATTPAPDGSILGPAFTPNQVQDAYGAAPLHDAGVTGRGVRVAIFGAGGSGRRELRAYARCFALEAPTTGLVKVGTRSAGPTSVETALDLQMVALMAPGAQRVTVYAIASEFFPVEFSAMLDRRNAPGGRPPHVISVSAGACETSLGRPQVRLTEHVLAAAAAGITVAAGSGDAGAFCPERKKQGAYPSASRWMTSVGGTAFTLNDGNRILDEIPWNDKSFAPSLGLAGGGGFSRFLKRPPFQRGLGRWGDHRGYPDVALLADAFPGNAIYCNIDAQGNCDESRPGNPFQAGFGTSAATPLFAGIVALADQRLLAAGRSPLGFANPLLYRLGREGGRGALRDIVRGSISLGTPCCHAFPGYDRASGWGSVNAERLAAIALRRGPR
jgi:subtilase family serine protease